MSYISRLSHLSLSQLEKLIEELTRLQKEQIDLQFEIANTKAEIKSAIELAQIETRVYSGIKRYFS